jgi:Tfp pilus tip-associated adhesin PilY1
MYKFKQPARSRHGPCLDENTGEELWAFIPPDLLPKLKNLTGNTVEFFVDGTPRAYINGGMVLLIFGERRGGNHYFALDVSDPLNPRWKWEIHPGLSDFTEMGQTWSTPYINKIKYGAGDKWVFFIGGGTTQIRIISLLRKTIRWGVLFMWWMSRQELKSGNTP